MKKKLISIILIIIIALCVCGIGLFSLYSFYIQIINGSVSCKKDEQYLKMYEIDINNSLIGLSEEEVVKQLGKPVKIFEYNDKVYMYNAGYIYERLIFDHYNFWTKKTNYAFYITFDEENKVQSTVIKERP